MRARSARRDRYLLVAVLLVAGGCGAHEIADGAGSPTVEVSRPAPAAVPGEALIVFRSAARDVARRLTGKRPRGDVRKAGRDVAVLTLADGETVATAAVALADDPDVETVEPNYRYALQAADPLLPNQWALRNTGQDLGDTVGLAGVDMQGPPAWRYASSRPKAGRKSYVGVLDDGIDITHPDLAGVVSNPLETCGPGAPTDADGNGKVHDCHGWDFVHDDETVYDPVAPGADSHGTHVAGTIAALADNGIGVRGVATHVGIVSAKVISPDGTGTVADAVLGLEYLIDLKSRGVEIVAVNASWASGAFSVGLYNAIKMAGAKGIVVVTAAGNGASDVDASPIYPCGYARAQTVGNRTYPALDNVLCVAAHDARGNIAAFSNWGRTTVAVAAPGTMILSTTPGGTYAYFEGTSMATPHVTGLVALLAESGVPPSRIVDRITSTVTRNNATWNERPVSSGGRVNALRAVVDPSWDGGPPELFREDDEAAADGGAAAVDGAGVARSDPGADPAPAGVQEAPGASGAGAAGPDGGVARSSKGCGAGAPRGADRGPVLVLGVAALVVARRRRRPRGA
jgi:subtilisin family serine protease